MNANPTLRKAVLLGAPLLALLVVVTTSAVLADQLPAEVPSSWQGGVATETMPLGVYTGFIGGLVVLLGLGAQALRHGVGEPTSQRVLGGVGVGIPAALAALHVGILLAVRVQEPPYTAPWAAWVVAGGVLLAGGLLGAAAVQPIERHGPAIEPVRLEIAPGEAVVWTGTATAPWFAWAVLVVAAVVGVGLAVVALPWIAVLVGLLVAVGATLLRVTVTVGPAGVTARLGPLRMVRFHVPLDEVAAVHAEVVTALVYGGWGLRWLPGVHGVVLRSGPGLRVERLDGPDLVVTVDEAAEAAGVLQAHAQLHGTFDPDRR